MHLGPLQTSLNSIVCWKNTCLYRIQNIRSGKLTDTSFAIDNMYYVNFKIYEQENVPWCGEIQNQKLKVLGNTFNLHSNSTCAQEVWSLNQFVCMCSREN